MPISMRRKDRKGKALVDRSSRTSFCSNSRERGPAIERPVYSIAQGRTWTSWGGAVRSNQRR